MKNFKIIRTIRRFVVQIGLIAICTYLFCFCVYSIAQSFIAYDEYKLKESAAEIAGLHKDEYDISMIRDGVVIFTKEDNLVCVVDMDSTEPKVISPAYKEGPTPKWLRIDYDYIKFDPYDTSLLALKGDSVVARTDLRSQKWKK